MIEKLHRINTFDSRVSGIIAECIMYYTSVDVEDFAAYFCITSIGYRVTGMPIGTKARV